MIDFLVHRINDLASKVFVLFLVSSGVIVTVLCQDSSVLWRMYPESMLIAHEMHDKCLRQAIVECNG